MFLATGFTDLRRGIDGLASIVQQQFELDPFTNTLFLFCGIRPPTGSHRRSQSEFSAFLSYVQYTPLCAYLITDKEPETSRKFDKKPP